MEARADQLVWLAVQQEPTLRIERHLADAEGLVYLIEYRAVSGQQFIAQCVEVRIGQPGPEVRVGNAHLPLDFACFAGRNDLLAAPGAHRPALVVEQACHHGDRRDRTAGIGNASAKADCGLIFRQARRGGIDTRSAMIEHIEMNRLRDHERDGTVNAATHKEIARHREDFRRAVAFCRLGIVDLDVKLVVRARLHDVRRIEAEAAERVAVAAEKLAVQPDLCGTAHGIEFEEQPLPARKLRRRKAGEVISDALGLLDILGRVDVGLGVREIVADAVPRVGDGNSLPFISLRGCKPAVFSIRTDQIELPPFRKRDALALRGRLAFTRRMRLRRCPDFLRCNHRGYRQSHQGHPDECVARNFADHVAILFVKFFRDCRPGHAYHDRARKRSALRIMYPIRRAEGD